MNANAPDLARDDVHALRRHFPDACWPNVWGEGQLLAFSGLDGAVNWGRDLVLQSRERIGDFDIRLPVPTTLTLRQSAEVNSIDVLLGDLLIAGNQGDPLTLVFVDDQTCAGVCKGAVELGGKPVAEGSVDCAEHDGVFIWAAREGCRWAVSSASAADARDALGADLLSAAKARCQFVASHAPPPVLSSAEARLWSKAVSVVKTNMLSPAGSIERTWSTPDRWPHKNMWLWDSAFQSAGLTHLSPEIAEQALLAILDSAGPDGMVPLMVDPFAGKLDITQPPVLAWATTQVFAAGKNTIFLRQALPALENYVAWDETSRDRDHDGLVEYAVEGHPLCRSGESGMDNSPRFDKSSELAAIDFNALLVHERHCIADLCDALGKTEQAQAHRQAAAERAGAIESMLWDEDAGFYMDAIHGKRQQLLTSAGFLPLFAGIPSRARAAILVQHLDNPATFGSGFAVPSVAVNQGTYTKDMWRGPTWININWLIYLGLRRYGFDVEAAKLRDNTLDELLRWYEQCGSLYEFYDSLGFTPPRDLDRKQRLASGQGMLPISDYHWTASATLALLADRALARTVSS